MTGAPWYLRHTFWMLVGTLVVPFFWILWVLPLSRAAYARVSLRWDRRF